MTRILRHGERRARVVAGEVWSAERAAKEIRDRARTEARALVLEAEQEAQRVRSSLAAEVAAARDRAEQVGLEQGRTLGEAKGLQEVFRTLGSPAERTRITNALVPVVLNAVRRLFLETLELEPRRIEVVVREMLSRVQRAQRISIEVHPDDAPHIAPLLQEMDATVDPRPDLARGDCVVRTSIGTVDGRLSTRLSVIGAALEGDGINWSPDPPGC